MRHLLLAAAGLAVVITRPGAQAPPAATYSSFRKFQVTTGKTIKK